MRMELIKKAQELQEELIGWRRYLHEHAETGFALTETTAFIESELEKMGYAPQKCGRSGLIATVGARRNGRVFLLRADMDGLPIKERSGTAFASKNSNMHACGHDLHAAMLLGAAKLLKEREQELGGEVRLLFQPAEEILEGAKDVIEAGALENVAGAMMLHVMTNVDLPTGTAVVSSAGVSAPAADFFTVQVQGKSCHGSAPWNGVDALTAAAHILIALEELSARELNPGMPAVLTIGSVNGGVAGNVIADLAEMKGTLRAFDEETRAMVKRRLGEISKSVAKAFRARAKVVFTSGCPTLLNDEKLSVFVEKEGQSLLGEERVFTSKTLGGDARKKSGGSEDFAYISQKVPSVMVAIAAGETGKGYDYPLHHPKVKFDEEALYMGAALYAHIAIRYFQQ